MDNEAGRFTLIFLGVPGDEGGEVELTHNWDESGYSGGRNFGHLAYQVDDIYATCQRLMDDGSDHQPPAARRAHGVRPHARRDLDRAAAEGPGAGAGRAVGVDAQHGRMVMLEIVAGPGFYRQLHLAGPRRGERRDGGRRPRRCRSGACRGGAARLAGDPGVEHALASRDHTGGNLAMKEATGCTVSGPRRREISPAGDVALVRRRASCASAITSAGSIENPRPHARPHRADLRR